MDFIFTSLVIFHFRLTGVMVILCTIIFIVYEAEFDVKLREFQKPMAFTIFHKPMALNVSEEETENVTLSGCRCSMKPWPAIDKIISALNISVPWLNHTIVRQNLDQRHPNLPFELLTGAENKRCSLLPTIFRYKQRTNVNHKIDSMTRQKTTTNSGMNYSSLFFF